MRAADLMGIGVPAEQARRQATSPTTVSATGASQASALQIGGDQYFVSVTATNSGNYLNLPPIGGLVGCYLGDDFIINNQTVASIVITASSGVTISYGGANTTGVTGVSVATHTTTAFYPITTSSWLGIKGT